MPLLDLLDRHAPGLLHLAAILVDDVLQFLRHAARAVHHQVAVREPAVDLLDPVHRQHVAVGLAGELVGPVAGADGHGQGIDTRLGDEPLGLVGIGQQLVVGELAVGAVAVLLSRPSPRLERAEAAQLAFDRHALRRGPASTTSLVTSHVVVEVGRRLAVFLERAVHHHAGEAVVDRALAGGRAVAVVLVHRDRDVRDRARRRPASGAAGRRPASRTGRPGRPGR